MNIKIPFESEIEFNTNISEITKISLEHDYNVNDGVILGNFYISGEYKTHPVSVNTDRFNYTLPFTVDISEDINRDTIEFNIEDFTYDIVDDNKLKVNITYGLKGDKKEMINDVTFEPVNEKELDSELEYIDSFLEDRKGDNRNEEDKENVGESIKEIREEEKTIMDTVKDSDDTFVTYHIHIVGNDDNKESICKNYNVSYNTLEEYNTNINELNVGDKIIIPEVDE